MDKHLKQFYHNKPTEYTWEILPINAMVAQPELFFIKCDSEGVRLTETTGFVIKANSVRLEMPTLIIDSDTAWFELSEDNVFAYDGNPVSDLEAFFGLLTGANF